ncbi:portal protein [Candidatus Liberibacter brunswickensis]|uniref:portal protein n=1 Tax=Candidatus Liberibacter brunswickensis TaxID=1968796 RepID=UPI002FE29A56
MTRSAEMIKDYFDNLQNQRNELNARMEEITGLLYPYKQSASSAMWDTTASEACIKLSSLLSSLITPSGQKWHGLAEPLVVSKDDTETKNVRKWCDDVTDTLFSFRERSSSGFIGCLQAFYASIVEFGTGCFYIEEDEDEDGVKEGIKYISIPISDVYVGVNHQNQVDSVYRIFKFTADQIAKKWGEDKLTSRMKTALEKEDSEEFEFIHAVYPKTMAERKEDFPNSKGAFHSKILSKEDIKFFEENQLNTLPYVIGRYRVRANEIYGKSPALEALPAIRRLNEISNELVHYANLALKPPYIASGDAKQVGFKIKAGQINTGAVNREGKPLFHPLSVGNPLPYYEEVKRIQDSIHSLFFLDLFQVLDDKASRSATESMEKTREKGAFVSPIVGGLQSEFIGMMIRRELDILDLQDKLPAFISTDILGNDDPPNISLLKVEYTSPLFKYQQAETISSVLQSVNNVIELGAKTGDPSCIDHINLDEVARIIMLGGGSPASTVRDMSEVIKIRKKRAGQIEQMRQQQIADQQEQVGVETGAQVAREVMMEKMRAEMREGSDG